MTKATKYRPRLTEWCRNGCVFFFNCLCSENERKAQEKADKQKRESKEERKA